MGANDPETMAYEALLLLLQSNKPGIKSDWVIKSITARMETKAAGMRLKVQSKHIQIQPLSFFRETAAGERGKFAQMMSLGFMEMSMVVDFGCLL